MSMTNDTIDSIANVSPIKHDVSISKPKYYHVSAIVKQFSLNTSTHGVSDIARSRSISSRIFWTIILSFCACFMIFLIVQAIRAYLQYPTQTSVSFVVEWPQSFPAVTVCNYSPLRYDRFVEPFLNYTNTFNLINTSNATEFTKEHARYIHQYLLYKLNRNESLMEFFYPLETMMLSCTYNIMPCTVADFTWFISSSFGLCYTFNARLKPSLNKTIKQNSENGVHATFELRFYVHQHQYVPYLSNGIGMVVLVHDNIQIPNIEMSAMQLAPGQHHKLNYKKKTSSFLPAPYTTCNDKVNIQMQAMYEGYHNTDYGYSQLPCFLACLQIYTYENCGCGNPFRWATRSIIIPGTNKTANISLCDIENPCYTRAATKLMNDKRIWMSYCHDCTQECTWSEFQIKSSSVLAPPSYLFNDIKQFVEESSIPLPANWSITWKNEIQSSYVSLSVLYETTQTEIYSQQATISVVDVVSNIGGQTGLWIGISFLSMIEIVEMLYQLIRAQCYCLWTAVLKHCQTQESVL
ncbi:hypothetical protein I4U23_008321 [Adineta vaga]|nr:hypothetical protein I4U23_008321 [Adineta vaga]